MVGSWFQAHSSYYFRDSWDRWNGTFRLLWLLLHEIHDNHVRRDVVFLLNEGTKLEDGRESARLLVLTITSATVRQFNFSLQIGMSI